MSEPVLTKIRQLLISKGAMFSEKEHAPTYTSAESAAARGDSLGLGAKALLLKTDDSFRLFILPSDKKLDCAAIKRELKIKKIRFATPEELHELTGLVPGAVPPFGPPIFPIELFADVGVGAVHERIAFNAGSLTNSISIPASEWEAIAQPKRFAFTKSSD